MKEPNPYAPPSTDASASGTLPFPLDWNRFVNAFVGCSVALALGYGAVVGIHTTYTLQAFAEGRVGGLVALAALREVGPFVVVIAAMLALVITMHRQSAPSGSRVTTRQLSPFLLALPIAAPAAGCVMVGAAFVVTSHFFGASIRTFWTSMVDFADPKDVLVGVLIASLSAPLLVVVAPFAIRLTFWKPLRLRFKIAVAILTSWTVYALAGVLWRAADNIFYPPVETLPSVETVPSVEPLDIGQPPTDCPGSQAD